MKDDFHERPKYQSVADSIEKQIRLGQLDGNKMPSVRGVARQYQVSIVTASRALQVLRDKGVIESVERSGSFLMPGPSAERWALLLRVTPGAQSTIVSGVLRQAFEKLALQNKAHLHLDVIRLDEHLTVAQAAAAPEAIDNGIQGVFFLPSRSSDADAEIDAIFLEGCMQCRMPVVLLERYLRTQHNHHSLDLVSLDDVSAGYECTQHLLSVGCQRIALAVASPTSTHRLRAAGYLSALAESSLRKKTLPELIVRLPDEMPTPKACTFLADTIMKKNIDGVICYHDYIAMGLVLELLQRGVNVPNDVAVAGFENFQVASISSTLGLTTYEYPVDRIAEEALRLLRLRRKEPLRPPIRVVIPSKLIVRGSTTSQPELHN